MIEETRDVDLINRLVSRDFPGADMSEVMAEPMHLCLVEDESGAIFAWRGPGIYEVHLFFAARGKAAVALFMRMVEMMRAKHGARLFWALIPVDDRKTRLFARWCGWASHGQRETQLGPKELFVSENA